MQYLGLAFGQKASGRRLTDCRGSGGAPLGFA